MFEVTLFLIFQLPVSLKNRHSLISRHADQIYFGEYEIDSQYLFVLKIANHNYILLFRRLNTLFIANSYSYVLILSDVTYLIGGRIEVYLLFTRNSLFQG